MKRNLLRVLVILCLLTLNFFGCIEENNCYLDISGWEPQSFVDDIPIYTDILQDEIEVMTATHRVFVREYPEKNLQEKINGVFWVREPEERIPTICCNGGCTGTWNRVPDLFKKTYPDVLPDGYGGLCFKHWVFVSRVHGRDASTYVHELGHCVLGMMHLTDEERINYIEWEKWIYPLVREELVKIQDNV